MGLPKESENKGWNGAPDLDICLLLQHFLQDVSHAPQYNTFKSRLCVPLLSLMHTQRTPPWQMLLQARPDNWSTSPFLSPYVSNKPAFIHLWRLPLMIYLVFTFTITSLCHPSSPVCCCWNNFFTTFSTSIFAQSTLQSALLMAASVTERDPIMPSSPV